MSEPDADRSGRDGEPRPEARLRAHVEAILDRSSVRGDRADLAEELYGHLWQRWHDGVEAGLADDDASATAVSAFGGAERLGRELTRSYHSGAFASTIGVLVSNVEDGGGRPPGYWRIRAFTWLSMLGWAGVAGGALGGLTPVKGLIVTVGYLVAGIPFVLAERAFRHRQGWALQFWRLAPPTIVLGVVVAFVVAGPRAQAPILFSAGAFLVAAPWLYRRDSLSPWVIRRPVRTVVLACLLCLPLVGLSFAAASATVTDPTQATARDVRVAVTSTCSRVSTTGDLAVDVALEVRWARTDLLPFGMVGGGRFGEIELLWVRVPSLNGGVALRGPLSAFDATSGRPFSFRLENESLNEDLTVSNSRAVIVEPETMAPGHRYVFTWQLAIPAEAAAGVEARGISAGFDHYERFAVEAAAQCNGSAQGHEMARP